MKLCPIGEQSYAGPARVSFRHLYETRLCSHEPGIKKDPVRPSPLRSGGAGRNRTADLRIANATLSQLSYGPEIVHCGERAAYDSRVVCVANPLEHIILPCCPDHAMALAQPIVIVFAKAPMPGRCKTRLARRVGPVLAARYYQAMTEQVIAHATRQAPGRVVLACAPDTRHPLFSRLARRYGCSLVRQSRGTLGQRMADALNQHQRHDAGAVVIGTDQPDLAGLPLAEVLALLDATVDMLMAPTHDGGYWLIGGRRTPRGVFQGVAWSTPRVARQTRAAMRSRALRWREGPSMRDIDDYRDWCAQPRDQRSRLARAAVMPGLARRYVDP